MAKKLAADKPKFTLVRASSKAELFGLCAALLQHDSRATAASYRELYACAMRSSVALVGVILPNSAGIVNVGYVAYTKLNYISLTVFLKGIRELAPSELDSGDLVTVVQLVCPHGMSEEIYNFVQANNKVLCPENNIFSRELHEGMPYDILNTREGD